MKELVVVKVGGNVIDDNESLDQFLIDFALIRGAKILVHGGGKVASEIGKKLGIKPKMIDGRRVTDEETLDLVTMVYGGLLNKQIVAQLQAKGSKAIGLTGADGNLLLAQKRPVKDIDYGFAGDVLKENVNVALINSLVAQDLSLVVPALTHDGNGHMLNTNADTMASIIAQALADQFKVNLIYCFEQIGVLKDLQSQELFKELNKENTNRYIKESIIHSGMLPKLKNAFDAKDSGVSNVQIGHFSQLNELIASKAGTQII